MNREKTKSATRVSSILVLTTLVGLPVSVYGHDSEHVFGAKTARPYTTDDYLHGRTLTYNMVQARRAPNSSWRNNRDPVEPFHIAGNTYFVGIAGQGSYLITTPEGHILIEQPYEEAAPLIVESIRKLGFDPADIKVLTATEAHGDHVGAMAYFKELTGARVMMMEGDVELLEKSERFPPVKVDRVLRDRDQIMLGGTVVTAYNVPNHTRGSTTFLWQVVEDGQTYNMAEACCWSNYQRDLVSDARTIPHIRRTFAILKSLPVDIPTPGGHTDHFDMYGKLAKAKANPDVNPWIAPQDYRGVIAWWEWAFEQEVMRQLEEGPAGPRPPRDPDAPREPRSFPPFPEHP